MLAPRPARHSVEPATYRRGGGLAGDVAGFRRRVDGSGRVVISFVFGVDRDLPAGWRKNISNWFRGRSRASAEILSRTAFPQTRRRSAPRLPSPIQTASTKAARTGTAAGFCHWPVAAVCYDIELVLQRSADHNMVMFCR